MNLESQLAEGVAALGVSLPEGSAVRLLQYLKLVEKWGKVYNLTSVRKPEEMLSRHLLDSLAVLPHIEGPLVADVGSGLKGKTSQNSGSGLHSVYAGRMGNLFSTCLMKPGASGGGGVRGPP